MSTCHALWNKIDLQEGQTGTRHKAARAKHHSRNLVIMYKKEIMGSWDDSKWEKKSRKLVPSDGKSEKTEKYASL